jgi:SAM-dependent methyltransferase
VNEKADKAIEAYNAAAQSLSAAYNKLNTEDVLPGIADTLPVVLPSKRRAIDLGCGSGRDAFWLASRGFQVVGADASIGMIREAWAHKQSGNAITYIEDEIPTLSRVRARGERYAFFLMSAVWMHLDSKERAETIRFMADTAHKNATAYLSLRHGPSPADRPMFETSVEEVRDLAAQNGASARSFAGVEDKQGRGDVTWDYVALQFGQGKNHPLFQP